MSASSVEEFDPQSLSFYLPSYYSHLFPVPLMYRWLSNGSADFFARREFSFTLPGDVYIRYQSFNNAESFQAELKKRAPIKIDIGAVYNQHPRIRNTVSQDFIPLQKEFVLDIDLTDYDDVRTCCQGAKVCAKCWKFIALAVNILEKTLRQDFGFKHMLWVFSGRRGVHCWVCDENAINMDSSTRGTILEYLTVIRGGESKLKKVTLLNVDRPHAFVERSVQMIDEVFDEICHKDQNMLVKGDKNFDILPEEVKQAVANSSDRFADVMNYIDNNKAEKKTIRALGQELKLQLCFPRLDVNVSKELNHLLKSPFCIHPKTGQVCVPFDPEQVWKFDISQVPTITKLMDEVKTQSNSDSTESKGEGSFVDASKTSLAPYLKIFENFVNKLEEVRAKKNEELAKAEKARAMEYF